VRRLMVPFVFVLLVVFAVPALAGEEVNTNSVEYWCGENGVKYEPVETPFVVPEPPEGTTWTLLVLKAGSGDGENETFPNPVVGQGYSHSSGKDNSHAILCWAENGTTTTTTVAETTTTTIGGPTTTTTGPGTTTVTTIPDGDGELSPLASGGGSDGVLVLGLAAVVSSGIAGVVLMIAARRRRFG